MDDINHKREFAPLAFILNLAHPPRRMAEILSVTKDPEIASPALSGLAMTFNSYELMLARSPGLRINLLAEPSQGRFTSFSA